jgi:hypothetical protein
MRASLRIEISLSISPVAVTPFDDTETRLVLAACGGGGGRRRGSCRET